MVKGVLKAERPLGAGTGVSQQLLSVSLSFLEQFAERLLGDLGNL